MVSAPKLSWHQAHLFVLSLLGLKIWNISHSRLLSLCKTGNSHVCVWSFSNKSCFWLLSWLHADSLIPKCALSVNLLYFWVITQNCSWEVFHRAQDSHYQPVADWSHNLLHEHWFFFFFFKFFSPVSCNVSGNSQNIPSSMTTTLNCTWLQTKFRQLKQFCVVTSFG